MFGYNTYNEQSVSYIFNLNHLWLVLAVGGFIAILLLLLKGKTEKRRKITMFIVAIVLLVLEVGRIVWRFEYYLYVGMELSEIDWWWNISFQMCAIMTWFTIITLLLNVFVKKQGYVLNIMNNILFGCAMIGGILTYVYPYFISGSRPIWHFTNWQTILTHALLIFAPIYVVRTKIIKPKLTDLWKPMLGYVLIGSIAGMASEFSGNNFAYYFENGLFVYLGIRVPFELSFFATFIAVYICAIIAYLIAKLIYKYKEDSFKSVYPYFLMSFAGIILIVLIPLCYPTHPVKNFLALFSLLPIFITIGMIAIYEYYKKSRIKALL